MKTLLETHGVHLIGDFSGRTALSQSGRDFISAVEQIGCPLEILDLPLAPDRMPASGRFSDGEFHYQKPQSPLSVILWNSDIYMDLVRELPLELFENRRIIGVWYWETEQELPEFHRRGYDLVDEVWATTRFIAESFRRHSPVPVHQYPPLNTPLHPPAQDQWSLPAGIDNDRFVFLFSFDFRSVARRKNPEGLCEAFIRAFPEPAANGPLCVLKSIGGEGRHALELLELQTRYADRADILFLNGYLPVEQRDSLMARANCYVSLHRSEGLGLTLMECMSLGKPCIATGYSGNLEFMTPENSWLIPYKKVPVGTGAAPYPPDHTWAEPDVNAAAAALHEVYTNPSLAAEKGLKGQQTILQDYRLNSVSRRVEELLESSLAQPIRPKPALRSISSTSDDHALLSGRERAYHLLRECKALEALARNQRKSLSKRQLSPEVSELIGTLQKITKLQHQIQSETLRDLGDLKQRLKTYHSGTLDDLMRDRDLTTSMLAQLAKRISSL
ncbi:glycosyltransferase family 4 protein [Phragmitibacter flavus]|uniref:glycosyltransferase family 4 protein n=1 Tax=Phragmitibacter flavus TaxID=2576071 RepID=UPI00140A0189|nr:glycosyltransferase family 4 protein [Phragmitibacter flavus]